jgi:hypothetical protein
MPFLNVEIELYKSACEAYSTLSLLIDLSAVVHLLGLVLTVKISDAVRSSFSHLFNCAVISLCLNKRLNFPSPPSSLRQD